MKQRVANLKKYLSNRRKKKIVELVHSNNLGFKEFYYKLFLIHGIPKREIKQVLDFVVTDISTRSRFEEFLKVVFPNYKGFIEEQYLAKNLDVQKSVLDKDISSGFQHFLTYGFREMLKGERVLTIDIESQENIEDLLIEHCESVEIDDGEILVNREVLDEYALVSKISAAIESDRNIRIDGIGYNNTAYKEKFKDINLYLLIGDFGSFFEHFLVHGKVEIKTGLRDFRVNQEYKYYPPKIENVASTINRFNYKPLISIVMPVYNVSPKWLELAYNSLKNQWYKNWELCICDDASSNEETLAFLKKIEKNDCRIKVIFSEVNQNISLTSNKALSLCKGDFVALMDNDDELTEDALYQIVNVLQDKSITFVYSDEDKIDLKGKYIEPHYKPDFSEEMFMCHNYISHLGVVRSDLISKVGGWRAGFEGAQDYDLYLRLSELDEFKVYHINKVLYHWRKIPGSTASEFGEKSYANSAGKKALESAIERRNLCATVDYGMSLGTYKISHSLSKNVTVSVVIPFKDKPNLLRNCLDSIFDNNNHDIDFEVVCVNNQSTDPDIEEVVSYYTSNYSNVKFVEYDAPFNYSKINNYAVNNHTKGEYILLMNNDIEVLNDNWLSGMLEYAQQPTIGAVGAKLHYPNNTIQHAGIIIAPETTHGVITAFQGVPSNSNGYFSRLNSVCNYLAVTAAMLMVSRNKYINLGGLDENLAVAYNDVDFCLQLDAHGFRNVYTPYVEAIHHESISRGYEDSIEKLDRLGREMEKLKIKNPQYFNKPDRFFNQNLADDSPSFNLSRFNVIGAENLIPFSFEEYIIYKKVFGNITENDRVSVFSHFDKDNLIDDTVLIYLKELSKRYKVIFVSTSEELSLSEVDKLKGLVSAAIVKRNIGYDFGAWKTGIDYLGKDIEALGELLLCNDSVYGPFNSFSSFYDIVDSKKFDVVGILDNYEISYHLQSYFISYSASVINSEVFRSFWSDFIIYPDKKQIVLKNEIGLCKKLQQAGFYMTSLAKSEEIAYVNNAHRCWKELIEFHGFPFVKRELLKDNPLQVDLTDCREILRSKNSHLLSLVEKHIAKSL